MITGEKLILSIALISAVTFLTRAFPFILFDKNGRKPPDIILYLGKYLPPGIICCILVYCFKDMGFTRVPYGGREIISVLAVVLLHTFKSNALLSILGGTFLYSVMSYLFFT
ncbi:MAG: AzlD domain-containing protein [Clostridiales bacterium]|jgi:branched-subunit amino acid transport protein AzlD|nr:AzlD domain-containing protein [Clostridiales bacterium]